MKSFFQEYGGTIIASLVVVCLIAVCTVIKPLAAESHVSIVDKLSNYVEETLDNASENDLNSVLSENNKTLTIAVDYFGMSLDYIDCIDSPPSSLSITYTDGMTWGEWVNSEYNNIQFTLEFSCGIDDETLMENIESRKFEIVEHENKIVFKITTLSSYDTSNVGKVEYSASCLVDNKFNYSFVNTTDEIDSTKDYTMYDIYAH